ncbi:hypothetical protein CfE428DRAFT_5581 [Chthoniobacter flavus Ellin428]|uniref:Uncharacterized protein n=1 Tax=Chthoniobacter flavus Ellin428 TaxID=497964 RepID=B4D9J1_9BACT|nr:hypothetical protein [Chthoniobacter flavus]EDY16952.1 hypothetical protein CfE428DRAFT_5581 [Chthoniobacter flavus Ellin428]TCO87830.1 hypothetical protein EV701_120129 [Chthoniobacter flavus]
MDNLPSKDPVESKMDMRTPNKLPWTNQPGWHEPERLGVELQSVLEEENFQQVFLSQSARP